MFKRARPSTPSGHAVFGGATFQTRRNFYGTDDIPFTFVSDELDGVTLDNEGNPRPLVPRSFTSLSQAEEENGQSRLYLGIHWSFHRTEGITQRRQVADYVCKNAFAPRRVSGQPTFRGLSTSKLDVSRFDVWKTPRVFCHFHHTNSTFCWR